MVAVVSRIRVCVSLVAVLSCMPLRAEAQDAAPSADPREQALELYRQSRERYDVGDYDRAVALLREAFALHPEPNLLYNLARAYGNLGDFAAAIDAYRRFLEAAPESDMRSVIEARIGNYQEALERQQAVREREAVEEPLAAPQPAPRGPDPAGWILAGTGAALLVGAAVFGGLSLAAREEAIHEPAFLAASAASDRAVAFAWTANVGLVVGGLVAGLGLVLGIVDATREDPPRAVSLRIGPGGVEVAW